jgi:hypothetical protein
MTIKSMLKILIDFFSHIFLHFKIIAFINFIRYHIDHKKYSTIFLFICFLYSVLLCCYVAMLLCCYVVLFFFNFLFLFYLFLFIYFYCILSYPIFFIHMFLIIFLSLITH